MRHANALGINQDDASTEPRGRSYHSSTSQLNLCQIQSL